METLLLNPITLWLRWLLKKIVYKINYTNRHLKIEYLVEIKNSSFGKYNTLQKYARLRDAKLDDYSYVSRNTQVYNATIGKFCCIGPNVLIGLGAHPTKDYVSSHPLFYSTIGQAGGLSIVDKNLFDEFPHTTIGNDVWIGANAIIKYGIKIGNGAIIGSGAVVTKDVEPYSIVAGVPAKVLKYRFSQEQIDFLENFQWWNKDLDWLKNNKEYFQNIEKFTNTHSKK